MNTIMNMNSRALLGWVLALSVTLTGCGREEPAKPAENTAKAETTVAAPAKELKKHPVTGDFLAPKQVLVRGNGAEPGSIDPQLVEGSVGGHIVRDLFEGLTSSGPNGEVVPGMATSWESKEGNRQWVFHLRNNAKWTDGTPVTAHDFVYAWQRAVDPALASNYAYFLEIASIVNATEIINGKMPPSELGVKAVDDYTFEVNLSAPIPYLAIMTSHYTMFPAPRQAIEKHGNNWTKPGNIISNGAYQLVEWNVGEKMTAKRNTNYWDNEHTIIDEVVYLPIEDETAELQRYEAGELNFTNGAPVSQMDRLKRERADELKISPMLGTYMYQFNMKKPLFSDVRIRKALTLAIDRDIIVNHITKAGQIPAYNLTPFYIAGFEAPKPDFASWTQTQRDAEAVKLLAEAGYTKENPLQFELLYNTNEAHKAIAVAMSQMWKEKLGVQVSPVNMEWKTYLSEKKAGNFEVARYGWIGDYNEASTFLSLITTNSGNNDGRWSNAEYDKLLDEARFESDPNSKYVQAEAIVAAEFPVIPIYFYTNVALVSKNTVGYAVNNPQNNLYSKDMYIKAD